MNVESPMTLSELEREAGVFDQEPCQWCAVRYELVGNPAIDAALSSARREKP